MSSRWSKKYWIWWISWLHSMDWWWRASTIWRFPAAIWGMRAGSSRFWWTCWTMRWNLPGKGRLRFLFRAGREKRRGRNVWSSKCRIPAAGSAKKTLRGSLRISSSSIRSGTGARKERGLAFPLQGDWPNWCRVRSA